MRSNRRLLLLPASLLVLSACGTGAPASQTLRDPSPTAGATSSSPSPIQTPSASPSETASPTSSPAASPTRSPSRSPAPTRTRTRSATPKPYRVPVFEGTRRGSDEGPAYHAILVGQNFGGNGTYNVYADCRAGRVKITIHDDGLSTANAKEGGPATLNVSVNDATMIYGGAIHDGQVITGSVGTRVRLMTGWRGDHQFRIEYDCRNR